MTENIRAAKINAFGVIMAAFISSIITGGVTYKLTSGSQSKVAFSKCKSSYMPTDDEREEAVRFVQFSGITSEMRLNYEAYVDLLLAQGDTIEIAKKKANENLKPLLKFDEEVAEIAASVYSREELQNMNTAWKSDCMKPYVEKQSKIHQRLMRKAISEKNEVTNI